MCKEHCIHTGLQIVIILVSASRKYNTTANSNIAGISCNRQHSDVTPYNNLFLLWKCHNSWCVMWCGTQYGFSVMSNIACNAVSSVNCQISVTNRNFLSRLDFTPKWLFGMHGNFLEKNTFNVSNHKTYNADRDISWFPVLFFWINSNSEARQKT